MWGTNMFRNSEGMVIVLPSYPSVTLSWQPSREVACVQGAWSSMSSSSSSAACTESKRFCCRMTWLRPRQPRTARLSSDLMMRLAATYTAATISQHKSSIGTRQLVRECQTRDMMQHVVTRWNRQVAPRTRLRRGCRVRVPPPRSYSRPVVPERHLQVGKDGLV